MNYEQARTLKTVSARSKEHERLIGKILDRLDQMQGDINALGERIDDSDFHPTTLQDRVYELENTVAQCLPDLTPSKPARKRQTNA